MYNYVFIVCCANFVGYFIRILFPSSSIKIRTKKDDFDFFYLLENGICHVLQYLFTSIEETPTWLGVVVLFVCRIAIILVFSWFPEDFVLVVAKADGSCKPDHTLPLPLPLPLPQCTANKDLVLVVAKAECNHKPDHTLPLALPQTTANNFILIDREVNWLELPDHILSLVAIKLNRVKDFVRFGAVCHTWRSVYTENRHHMSRKPPLLMLATELNQDDQTRSLYSLADKRVVNSQVHIPHNAYCPGSCYGWLVIVNDNWDITLFNPFLSVNNQIQLPSAKTFTYHPNSGSAVDYGGYLGYVFKIVLSANPSSNPNYVAMAIYSDCERLAFCKPGDKAWTDVDSRISSISDVVYYEDQFYFVHYGGAVFSCDFNHPHPKVLQVAPDYDLPFDDKRYLVESFGELLQVSRNTVFQDDGHYHNQGFLVFKLDRVGVKWIKMDNVHGYVLFLGYNASYSISTVNFTGFKPNSIYFTDDRYEEYFTYLEKGEGGGCDIGVFNLEDCTHEIYYPTNSKVPLIPPHVWIEPTV